MFNNEKSSEYIIGNSFKELMSINQYDKITIKMIAEKSNIPRSTFYNYFEDKLDLLEWLLYENLFNSIIDLIDTGMELDALKMLFLKIEKDKAFYTNAFKIEGQDSFENLFKNILSYILLQAIETINTDLIYKEPISKEIISSFYSTSLTSVIKSWLLSSNETSSEELFNACEFFLTHSIIDLLNL